MIKITYFYGTMKSSKTANLLMSYHNYLENGIDPILVKPETDNRSMEFNLALDRIIGLLLLECQSIVII